MIIAYFGETLVDNGSPSWLMVLVILNLYKHFLVKIEVMFQKITILRKPIDNFMSSWRYYNGFYKDMRRKLPFYKKHPFIDTKGLRFLTCNGLYLAYNRTFSIPFYKTKIRRWLHFRNGGFSQGADKVPRKTVIFSRGTLFSIQSAACVLWLSKEWWCQNLS